MPKVSIILSTIKKPPFLKEAIDSVLNQTFSDWNLIIVTDPPLDPETQKLISDYAVQDKRIIHIHNPERLGFSKSLNIGLINSDSQYIARQDDDDVWCDNQKLAKQVEFMDKNQQYSLIGASSIFIDQNGQELYRYAPPQEDSKIRKCILTRNPFVHTSVMYRREDARKVGYYEGELEDIDLWLKLGTMGKMKNFPEFFIKYRTPTIKNQLTKERIKRTKNFIALTKKHGARYPGFVKALIINYLKLLYLYVPKPIAWDNMVYKIRQTKSWNI